MQDIFIVKSTHRTCMIPSWNWFCLDTLAQDIFEDDADDKNNCILRETIEYDCPLILVPLCQAEVNSQRPKVQDNLHNFLS